VLVIVACTGPSMSSDLLDLVRHLPVVAVNGVFRLAPWAAAVAAMDICWWREYKDAAKFAGRKFSGNIVDGTERVVGDGIAPGTCSGVLGLEAARRHFGATQIVMLGVDFHGTHFFGEYTGKLNRTTPSRRDIHAKQFDAWAKGHPEVNVLNATPGSKLKVFPVVSLDEVLGA